VVRWPEGREAVSASDAGTTVARVPDRLSPVLLRSYIESKSLILLASAARCAKLAGEARTSGLREGSEPVKKSRIGADMIVTC
jgi:hypothetical protein